MQKVNKKSQIILESNLFYNNNIGSNEKILINNIGSNEKIIINKRK